MIKLDAISLQRGSKPLLEQASAVFHPKQKIAIIGANGSGKSSLFQLLLGKLPVDEGELSVPSGWHIAHMAQEISAIDRNALDYVMDGDQQLRDIESRLKHAEDNEDHHQLAQLHQQLDSIDGYNARVRAEQLMQGLGFAIDDTDKPVNSFSGGWRIRLNLAQALMCPSDLLLLDEPTNHLDIDATLWLEQWLQRYPGTLVLISHDRDFIDSVCDIIANIEHRKLLSYRGNYSAFERQRAERLSQQQANFEKQQRRVAEIHSFVNRFRAKATKARQAQSRLKELQRMELIAPAHIDSPFNFSFPEPERFSDPLLNFSHAELGYPQSPVIHQLNLSIHPNSRIGLLGANGAGKSTLIKSLANELALISGERIEGEHLKLGYFSQHQMQALDLQASPALHLQRLSPKASEQSIRNFLGGFNFNGDMALETIENFSGGEKARLALAIVVWQKPNLLLLDEPTNHLDLEMCHALTVALQAFTGAVILVSHDRHLLRNTVDQLLLVHDGVAENFEGDLQDYTRWLLSGDSKIAQNNSSAKTSNIDKKLQRQQAAEARKKLQPINKSIARIEKNIDKNSDELSSLEQSLAESSLYEEDNKNQLQQLLQQQGKLKQQGDELEEQWLALHDELEAIAGH